MSETITTKFSVNDRCYYVVHPTADILACTVDYVRVTPTSTTPTISYKIHRIDTLQVLDFVAEDEIDIFSTSKTSLLAWLAAQTLRITNMTEPE